MQLVHTINFHPLSPIPRLRSGVRVQNGNKRISQKPNGPLFVAATTTNKATCSFFFLSYWLPGRRPRIFWVPPRLIRSRAGVNYKKMHRRDAPGTVRLESNCHINIGKRLLFLFGSRSLLYPINRQRNNTIHFFS